MRRLRRVATTLIVASTLFYGGIVLLIALTAKHPVWILVMVVAIVLHYLDVKLIVREYHRRKRILTSFNSLVIY